MDAPESANPVALLIPHYNSPDGLCASLASVRPDEPCDVVIVDDGSTQRPVDTAAARDSFAGPGRLFLLRLGRNAGIEGALNAGLEWIRGRGYEYVARLDCGDRNKPGRIARQLAYLTEHPDVVLVGTRATYVDLDGEPRFVLPLPAEHDEILAYLRRNSAFMHPSVMFRTSVLDRTGLYPTAFPRAEDYEFFWRMASVGRVANIPEPLIDYELDPAGLSLSGRRIQLRSRLAIQRLHNDWSAQALLGMARTAAVLAVPYGAMEAVKAMLHRLRPS